MKARFSTYSCNGDATRLRAVKLMRKLLKKQGFAPDVLVTDKLRSYGAAKAELGLSARHEQGLRKNNRAENSHQPHGGGSARCSASNRRDQPNAFYPFRPPSTSAGEDLRRPGVPPNYPAP
jgi:hypothetical protein